MKILFLVDNPKRTKKFRSKFPMAYTVGAIRVLYLILLLMDGHLQHEHYGGSATVIVAASE